MVESRVQELLFGKDCKRRTKEAQDVNIPTITVCSMLSTFRSYHNKTTDQWIDYYEIEVKPFFQQVYPGLKPARLVGYDGQSPGPTFHMERGREAVVRFINQGDNDLSVHLHGSYSTSHAMQSLCP